jgi:putative salt-induced outer membrane protein YdiY
MARRRLVLCVCAVALLASSVRPVFAQAPTPPPHKIWDVVASLGVSTTSGNSSASQFNAGYDLTYDPLTVNIFKTNAVFLRGTTEGELSAQRFLWNVRDQYKINGRSYVFGQNMYLRDNFKKISYLDAATGGIGFKAIATDQTKLDVDAGVGAVWEKNTGQAVKTSGAITAGEKLQQQLSSAATFTQSVTALWKTNDASDSLYTFGVGIAVAMSTNTQLKFEVLDVYKNKPPTAAVKKNDVATVVALVFKS